MPQRQSNIELLRIACMLMVVGLHANFGALGAPKPLPVAHDPSGWLGRTAVEMVCISSVDCFVLITGWFGTRFKARRAGALLFQTFFVSLVMTALVAWVTGHSPGSWRRIAAAATHYWFVYSYLLFYLLTPLINSWLERVDERGLRRFLLIFMGLSVPLSFFVSDLTGGHTALWFVGLYLLGRYVRLYLAPRLAGVSVWALVATWGAITAAMTLVYWGHIYLRGHWFPYLPTFIMSYTNPLTVVSAVSLLLIFARLSFTSRWVNWLAAGSLTVYLTHQQVFVRPLFFGLFRALHDSLHGLAFFATAVLAACVIYVASALLDALRRLAWRGVEHLLDRSKAH